MKKAVLFFTLCFGLFTLQASAQTTTGTVLSFRVADSAEYAGKYKYEGLPFEYMEISIKEGKLFYSGGEYNGALAPMGEKKDIFDANGQAVFTFLRDEKNKVVTLQIDYQGQTFAGQREEKKG
jgi:cytochrome c